MLSATCEYALRALVLLAREEAGRPMLGKDLARLAEVPPNYLSKILNTLKRVGILEATRGTGGGYRLLKTPDEIRLLDVVEVFDSPMAKPMCVLGSTRECDDGSQCSAHTRWSEVRRVYVAFLESTTLGSIANSSAPVIAGQSTTMESPARAVVPEDSVRS